MANDQVRSQQNTALDAEGKSAFMAEPAQNSADAGFKTCGLGSTKVDDNQGQMIVGHRSTKSILKRTIDVIGSFLGLIVLSPVFGLIAFLIKLDSSGPVVFKQERVGLNGRLFKFYKFRSMHQNSSNKMHKAYIKKLINGNPRANADLETGMKAFKLVEDDRITKFGRVLRRTSLDELPQLFNVLKGEMSLVGPRPAIGYEVEMYKDWYKRRLSILPGMTGLWQVSGRSQKDFDEMMKLDLAYVDKWSFWLDLKILWKTVFVVFKREGAW